MQVVMKRTSFVCIEWLHWPKARAAADWLWPCNHIRVLTTDEPSTKRMAYGRQPWAVSLAVPRMALLHNLSTTKWTAVMVWLTSRITLWLIFDRITSMLHSLDRNVSYVSGWT